MAVVVNIRNGESTRSDIQSITGDRDNKYVRFCSLWAYVEFSNIPFNGAQTKPNGEAFVIGEDWNIPIQFATGDEPRNHATYLDGRTLDTRAEGYQEVATQWFAETIIADYLRSQSIPFDKDSKLQVSATALELSAFILAHGLSDYLGNPAGLVNQFFGGESDTDPKQRWEVRAFIAAAQDNNKQLLNHVLTVVELGGSEGDQDVYILVGVDKDKHLPSAAGLQWYQQQIGRFVELNGYLPNFGYFLSDAQRHYRVVLGPDVTDREKEFLVVAGNQVFDMREGQPFTEPLPDPFKPKEEK